MRKCPDLLRRFIETDSGDAFNCLVRRHGPMVLGLARRIVRDHQLAEDVFQATFLVLGRKARAIRGRESLAAWLHSIAFRLAVRAKKQRARLGQVEARALQAQQRDPLDELTAREFLAILDEELNYLPEKYRLPLILCHLAGLTREDAAKRLGLSLSSVKARLERGRERLRPRLVKRGLGAGAAVFTSLGLSQNAGAVPLVLVHSTISAVLTRAGATMAAGAMAKGVIKMMFLTKLQHVGLAVLVVGAVGWGAGWLVQAGSGSQEAIRPPVLTAAVGGVEKNRHSVGKRVDLYGDPLPEGAVMRLGTVQLRAAGANLVLSRDGKTLIGVRGGRLLSFWDVATGKLKNTRELATQEWYSSILSPDGRRLATESLEIFDVDSGTLLRKLDLIDNKDIESRAFSPGGELFA